MGRFGPRGGCLGGHHGVGLSGHTSPLPQQPPPLLEGWVSPAHGSHLVPTSCPTWGGASCFGGCPFPPEAHSLFVPCWSGGSRHGAEQLRGTAGCWAGACPTLAAPLSQNLPRLCLVVALQPSGPGSPGGHSTLAGELAWSKVHSPQGGREGVQQQCGPWHRVSPQQSLILGTECHPSNDLILGTECQPRNCPSLKS